VVANVEPGGLPQRDRRTAGHHRHVAEVAQQPPQHPLGLRIHARHGKHPFTGGPQDLVLRDVDGELVVPDLQRERQPVMDMQLRALAQPSAQHLRALLDDDISGQQALVNGAFGLPPQRLRDDGDEVGGVRHAHGVRLPSVAV
jgi:hypothetical protein